LTYIEAYELDALWGRTTVVKETKRQKTNTFRGVDLRYAGCRRMSAAHATPTAKNVFE